MGERLPDLPAAENRHVLLASRELVRALGMDFPRCNNHLIEEELDGARFLLLPRCGHTEFQKGLSMAQIVNR